MLFIEKIKSLRNRSLSSLDESHDYYVHTRNVWRITQLRFERVDTEFSSRNQATGNTVDGKELSRLSQGYITNQLPSATFQHFVSLFDKFITDFISLYLTEYPYNLSEVEIPLKNVLNAKDKDEIVANIIQEKVHGLSYKNITDLFNCVKKITSLGYPNEEQIAQLVEVKESRNILVHNNGIANSKYVEKSKDHARFVDGEKLELPEQYHRESWELIKKVVEELSDAAITKLENRNS